VQHNCLMLQLLIQHSIRSVELWISALFGSSRLCCTHWQVSGCQSPSQCHSSLERQLLIVELGNGHMHVWPVGFGSHLGLHDGVCFGRINFVGLQPLGPISGRGFSIIHAKWGREKMDGWSSRSPCRAKVAAVAGLDTPCWWVSIWPTAIPVELGRLLSIPYLLDYLGNFFH